jgi:protein-tyrosine-phosphatase
MAEAMARDIFVKAGKDADVSSAGTYPSAGAPASENSVLAMKRRGLDITRHRARVLDGSLVEWADVILAMSDGNKTRVISLFPQKSGVFTLMEYAYGETGDVSDPFFQDLGEYERCAAEINKALLKIAKGL